MPYDNSNPNLMIQIRYFKQTKARDFFRLVLQSLYNIIIMKNTTLRKKIQFEGHSQFTRSKLESQYNPKYRTAKHQLMSFQETSSQDTHQYRSREENQICQKAVHHIKKGSNLIIDWNTKTNFRTNLQLPKLKTQPSQPHPASPITLPDNVTIEHKRIELAKLLHVRQKKHYLRTKRQQQEEKALFGTNHSIRNVSQSLEKLTNRKNNFLLSAIKQRNDSDSIEKVQSSIIKNSKLQILKDQLKAKFAQIRGFLERSQPRSHKKQKKSKGFFG